MASVTKREWTSPKGESKTAWVVRYTDAEGTRRMGGTFKTRNEAKACRLKIETQLRDETHLPDARTVTVAAACEIVVKHNEIRVRDGRLGKGHAYVFKTTIDRSIIPHLGKLKLTELRPTSVEFLYEKLMEDGLAPITAKQRIYILRRVEDFAYRRDLMRSRPIQDGLANFDGGAAKPVRTFTQDEMESLISALNDGNMKRHERSKKLLECAVHIAAFCGLRYGEIMGLSLKDVDFRARLLRVRHNLSKRDGLKGTKTAAGVRDVPLPKNVAHVLKAWIDQHYVANPDNLILRTGTGQTYTPAHFHEELWRPLLRRAGLEVEGQERPHFHACRHFCASWWLENGLPITEVSRMIGHSSVAMTLKVYAHSVRGNRCQHDVFDAMASRLLIGPTVSIDAIALPAAQPETTQRQQGLTTY